MDRASFGISVLALLLTACGGGGGSGGTSSPTPAPTPAPTATPTPSPKVGVTQLYTFHPELADGGQPNGPLLQAGDGSFYGTTRAGGEHSCSSQPHFCGTVFKITPAGAETVLYSFGASASDGFRPTAPLIEGTDGALYGMTAEGGVHGAGTVFKITLNGTYSVLYSFDPSSDDGASPVGGLIQASDGNFYGMTSSGGANHCDQIPTGGGNCGTIFKITPNGVESVIHSFGSSPTDGIEPQSSLFQASDGNFYGTTVEGGANSCTTLPGGVGKCGTVFRMSPAGVVNVLHSFGEGSQPGFLTADGIAPQGPLIQGSDGALYGTTASGGGGTCGSEFGCGTVFRMTLSGQLTVLYAFSSSSRSDGYGPTPFLIQASDGNFYGTTHSGGAYPEDLTGTVFRLTPSGSKIILYSFGPLNTAPTDPLAGVIQAMDGAFYGVTAYTGGSSGAGNVFRLTLQ